jgi:Kef-type K+ transport system membrane component KefB
MPTRRGYLLLVVLPFLALLVALHLGAARHPAPSSSSPLAAPAASAHAGLATPTASSSVGLLLAQVLAVLLATRACGLALRPLGQPHVVGEMLAGILLGPSLLGLLAPAASAVLFPPSSLPVLSALSQLGMVLYMFLVGLDLDTGTLCERGGVALLISHASIVVPFALGTGLSLVLFGRFAPPGLPFTPFALFLGAAMSVTAFPVLARILAERGLQRTPLGGLALSAAAVDDVSAWTILAAITVVVQTAGAESVPLATVLGLALFVGGGWLVRRPLRRVTTAALESRGGMTHGLLATLVGLALAGGCVTEALGLHALFGAFFAGLLLSKERRLAQAARERLEGPLIVVLVPLYFAFTGLRTRLDLMVEPEAWLVAFVVVGVAVIGKLGGSALAARASGVPWRDAAALGVLMNTRGLMELVILNVGLDLGVVSPTLFSILVLMAFVTTLMTNPLLSALAWRPPP